MRLLAIAFQLPLPANNASDALGPRRPIGTSIMPIMLRLLRVVVDMVAHVVSTSHWSSWLLVAGLRLHRA
jgi:hypothetical protein